MEARELRVDNYVLGQDLNGLNHSIGDYKVKLIDPIMILNSYRYKPIPLNEEWLLILGFVKWKNKNIWTRKGVMIYLHSKYGFCYGKASSRTKLKSVHHVQNLFHAIKQEELTINENEKIKHQASF